MAHTTLIEPETLAAHLDDGSLVIVDCRFNLQDPAWGEQAYAESHVPGALYAHLDRDLSGRPTGTNGRHPLPEVEALRDTFSRLGIDRLRQVVAYDQDTGMYAARLWWLLRWLGHDGVAVLNGGFAAWTSAGYPVSAASAAAEPRQFRGEPQPGWIVGAGEIEAAIGRGDYRLLDARAPERYAGVVEPIDRAAGHIPGAHNYFFKTSLDAAGRFLPAAELRTRLDAALDGTPPGRTVSYCGSGITASHTLLAMEHAGLTGAKLYPGSWSEWSSDERRPVER